MTAAFDDWMKTVQAGSENDLSGFLPSSDVIPTKLPQHRLLAQAERRLRPLLLSPRHKLARSSRL